MRSWLRRLAARLRARRKSPLIHPAAVIYEPLNLIRTGGQRDGIAVGAHSHIRGELLLLAHGGHISIGEYCYVGEQTRIWSGREITIGDRVLIAHQVTIMDNRTHPVDPVARHEQFKTIITTGHPRKIDLGDRPVRIEDDVWIGCNCIILRGVTIGKAAIVSAGSVVRDDVPPWTIVSGNPARPVGQVPRLSDPAGHQHAD